MNSRKPGVEREALLEEALREFRASAQAAAARPEEFWSRQREAVMARLGRRPRSAWKPVLAWVSACAVILAIAGVWLDRLQAVPASDIAAGYDQDLLLEVERLATADVPAALEPAMLLADEIGRGRGNAANEVRRSAESNR
jgi:hypothetical protein